MHIPVIIVSYRNSTDVVRCLLALEQSAADPAFDVYICENGGTLAFDTLVAALNKADGPCDDDTAAKPSADPIPRFVRLRYLRLRRRTARVVVAEATENFGYAGAINAWLRALFNLSAWPGVWILNPDTLPDPLALAELAAWSATRGKGMVGSRIVLPESPDVVRTRGLRWEPIPARTEAVGHRTPAIIEPDPDAVETRLESPTGVSMYVTRKCFEAIGFMDESYFLYFEELDWGYRARHACGIGYAHKSVVVHYGGTTIGSGRTRAAASPFSVYLDFRNRINFVRRHHPRWMAWTVLILIARSFEYALIGAPINTRTALSGIKAGLAGESGRPDRMFEFRGVTPQLRERRASASPDSIRSSRDCKRGAEPRFFRKWVAARAKQRAKVAISLAYYFIAAVTRSLCRIAGRPPRHRLVVLYYHTIPAASRASFARQLDILGHRAKVVPADFHGCATAQHSVAITFDDAMTSVLDVALPELRMRGMPATIFVPAGSLGRPPEWQMDDGSADNGEDVATADALRASTSDLVRLGAHSLTHPHLPRVPREEARREIAGCRDQMRDIFSCDVGTFAFPYGDHDAATVELCREAGYEYVFTSLPHPVDPAAQDFVRGRVSVEPSDGPLEFYLKMSGSYAWMAHFSAAKKKLMAPRYRY